ncbi:MAG: hypothetical protein JST68_27305 [Bacteroidetes bacterium]|nr:hypothetical protein [Bacteroidota bacterium]
MKKLPILLLLALGTSCGAFAQLQRGAYKLTMPVDKSTVYEQEIKESPYVLPNNTIQLYPGETVFIEVEMADSNITSMTAVKENQNPSKTLILSFSQETSGKKHESMMLKVVNPFKQRLFYGAMIYLMRQKKWAKTDVLPVEPGLSSYENWPDVITSIGLGHWSFKSK